MKHTHFLLAVIIIALSSCNIEDSIPKPIPGAKADFEYYIDDTNPLKVTFANKSTSGLYVDFWDYGDDTYYRGSDQVTHIYKSAGTYTVTLDLKDKNNYPYRCQKQITVSSSGGGDIPGGNYKKVYLKGFKLYSISKDYESFYIQYELQCPYSFVDDGVNILTTPQLMRDYMLPITVEYKYLMGDYPNPFDWFDSVMFTVYCSPDSYESQAGDIILVKYLSDPNVMDNTTEYIFEQGGTKVGLLFDYVK